MLDVLGVGRISKHVKALNSLQACIAKLPEALVCATCRKPFEELKPDFRCPQCNGEIPMWCTICSTIDT